MSKNLKKKKRIKKQKEKIVIKYNEPALHESKNQDNKLSVSSTENTRFKYSKCPFCGYDKAEDWFASNTWYCPNCGKTNLNPAATDALIDQKLKTEASKVEIKKTIQKIKVLSCSLTNYKKLDRCSKGRLEKLDESYILTCCCGTPFLVEKTDYKLSTQYCDVCKETHSKAFYCNNCNNIHSFDSYGRITHLEKLK